MAKPRSSKKSLLLASAASGCLALSSVSAQQGDIIHVHDPEIVKEGDTYYIFSTGHGVPIRTSRDLVNWELSGRVFEEDVPSWAAEEIQGAVFPWAPGVAYFNERFHLYYSVSTFGSQRSVIGLATSKTLDPDSSDYGWTDHGKVVESHRGQTGYNAIDAAVVLDDKGQPWLTWGSFHWGNREPAGIMLLPLDYETGKPKEGAEERSIARRPVQRSIEAPYLINHRDHFYLFVSYDHCCRGVDSTYNIRVGRAESVEGPYVDREGNPMLEGYATLVIEGDGDRIRGPGHNSVLIDGDRTYLVHHFYDARNNGIPTLQIRPLTWDEDGWFAAGEPLAEPPVPDEE